jgi:hypothetical protein
MTHPPWFYIPSLPSSYNTGELYAFWLGTEDYGETDVLQPVLQFGSGWSNGNFGDAYVIAAWWGPDSNGNFVVSNDVSVSATNTILGKVVGTTYDGSAYYDVEVRDNTTSTSTSLMALASSTGNQYYYYVEFEVPFTTDFTSCSNLPSSGVTDFTYLYGTDTNGGSTFSWSTVAPTTTCTESVTTGSNYVYLYY